MNKTEYNEWVTRQKYEREFLEPIYNEIYEIKNLTKHNILLKPIDLKIDYLISIIEEKLDTSKCIPKKIDGSFYEYDEIKDWLFKF